MTTLAMAEVLDLSQLAQVLEDFSGATGLATVAVDARGIPVTPPCAFTDFCTQMRSDPARNSLCHGCDAHGGLQSLIEGAPSCTAVIRGWSTSRCRSLRVTATWAPSCAVRCGFRVSTSRIF